MNKHILSLLAAGSLAFSSAHGQLPDREAFGKIKRDLDQVPLSAFQLDPELGKDLQMEIWAQSPLLFSPVAMDVDPQGRIWLTEGIDYNQGRRVSNGQSIMVVSDSDGDGKADKSHVFVSEPKARHAPLGLAVFDNKIVLSATPDLIVYTDVDRNAKFDPKIDKREVLLTGFQNSRHDHTLHAAVGSPSGQWYFSFGNCGADVKTKDGRHFLAGCYYGHSEAIGKKSSDGRLWVGGVVMRMNPDGTGLTAIGHNLRNAHDMGVNSFGDVFHSDNDDPAHCRSTWLMEYGNAGYGDLRDASRSWEEVAKSWHEPDGHSKNKRYSNSHWRQDYPGALPSGTVYGAGSPIGQTFHEGEALGSGLDGAFLSCDMVRKELMAYVPKLKDAQVEMGEPRALVGLKPDQRKQRFLPTDVVVGTDGAIYLSDFHNDTSRRTNQLSGTIYRITRKDHKNPGPPKIDFASDAGLVAALQSPARNLRTVAVNKLVTRGDAVFPQMKKLFESAKNPYVKARPIWVMAQLGSKGKGYVRQLLDSKDRQLRLVAYRALRFAQPKGLVAMADKMANDKDASVRREVALSLRNVPYPEAKDALAQVIAGYDGKNRWYLEAIGAAADGRSDVVYDELVRPAHAKTPPAKWNQKATNLAWRLRTPKAIDDLHAVILAQKPAIDEFRRLAMGYASYRNDAERSRYKNQFESLAKAPGFEGEEYQLTIAEVVRKDLNDLQGEGLTESYVVPKQFGPSSVLSDVKTITALKGNLADGKIAVQRCVICHKIGGVGVSFGPQLTNWGQTRGIEEIVQEIVHPDAKLAHGFDKPVRLKKGSHVAEGMLSNYSWHAGSLKIKLFGGEVKKILFRRKGVKIEELKNHSWMPDPSRMGMTDQNVRDIAEYLKKL